MINITRNKRLYAQRINTQEKILENAFKLKIILELNNIYKDVANRIAHGNTNILIDTILRDYIVILNKTLRFQYIKVGQFGFKQVNDRLQEVEPKKAIDWYKKNSEYNFWLQFNFWVEQQAVSKVTRINKTTRDILKTIIQKGIESGLSYSAIAKEIRLKAKFNRFRADSIAVTETHSAFNRSIFGSVESNSVKMDTKEWINTGERVRNTPFDHLAANGEKVAFNEPFVKTGENLMYPGDVTGSAANIIRCKCVSLYNTAVTEIKPID